MEEAKVPEGIKGLRRGLFRGRQIGSGGRVGAANTKVNGARGKLPKARASWKVRDQEPRACWRSEEGVRLGEFRVQGRVGNGVSGVSRASGGVGGDLAPLHIPWAWRGSGGHSQTGMSLQQSVRPVCQSLSWVW